MADLKRALRHYGFSKAESNKPNWFEIARRLGLRRDARFNGLNASSNKQSLLFRDFATSIKSQALRKYQRDTEIVDVLFRFNYRVKLKDGKTHTNTYRGTIVGTTRERAGEELMMRQQRELDYINQDSPVEVDEYGDVEIVEERPANIGNGVRVVKGIKIARMRRAMALKLDGDFVGDDSWDRKADTCCFDYLFYKYADKKGIKKFLPKNDIDQAYANMVTFFTTLENPNPIRDGLTTNDLERFCRNFDITIIALDKKENVITYFSSKNQHNPALIYMVANNHFYPVEYEPKRKLIATKNSKGNYERVVSDKIDKKKTEGDGEKVNKIMEGDYDCNEKAFNYIKEKGVLPTRLDYDDSGCVRLIYTDEVIHLNKPAPEIVEFLKGQPWTGESATSLCFKWWGEFCENNKIDLTTTLSPQVQDVLELDKVKDRTQYGTTLPQQEIDYYHTPLPPVVLNLHYYKYDTLPTNCPLDKYGFKIPPTWVKKTKIDVEVKFKPRTRLQQKMIDGDVIAIDTNKCYPTCLANPLSNFLKFDAEDCWEEFDGEIKEGLYAVETDDITLLQQSKIYGGDILKLAMQEGIEFRVLKQLIPKNPNLIDKELFCEFFKITKEKTGGKKLMKLVNNTLTGVLGKTTAKKCFVDADQDAEAIWRNFFCGEEEDEMRKLFNGRKRFDDKNIILDRLGEGEESVYVFGIETRSKKNEHTLPIYIQILDWANIRLYELTKKVGGKLLMRHTDCIVVDGGNVPVREMTNCWGDYSFEKKKVKLTPARMDRDVKFNFDDTEWIDNGNLYDSNFWKDIIKYGIDNGGLMISGRAGTGKSFIPKSAFEEGIMKLNEDTKTMSFTNKASRGIMGTTIHKLFRITRSGNISPNTLESLKHYKYFIVDEVGMVPSYLWKILILLKRKYPNKIFILMGDYRQLTPIEDGKKIDVFNHPIVKYLCNRNRIELTEMKRYNLPLWNFLERGYEHKDWSGLERRKVSCDEIYENKSVCFTNDTRKYVNDMCMDYFKNLTRHIKLPAPRNDEGMFIYKYIQDAYLYAGLPIMSYTNNTKLEIINSEEFVVVDYDDEKIYVDRVEGGESFEIEIERFHSLFVVNYCATAHKSQGATYKCKVFLWEWDILRSDKKLCYTACSRTTCLENLIIVDSLYGL